MSKQTDSAAGGAMLADGPTTRRAALRAFASLAAFATVPAIARAPTPTDVGAADPIFAAIANYHEVAGRQPAIAKELADALANGGIVEFSELATKADWDALDACHDARQAARDAVGATIPTTLEGIRAGLEFFGARPGSFHLSLLKSPVLAA